MSAAAHAAAVLDLLYAAPNLVVFPEPETDPETGNTIVPNEQAPPYVTVHVAIARPTDGRLPMRSRRVQLRIYCHCTGETDTAARLVSDMVAGALLDARPAVAGRVVYPIRFETNQPPRPDESTGQTTSTLTDVYVWQTDPGTP